MSTKMPIAACWFRPVLVHEPTCGLVVVSAEHDGVFEGDGVGAVDEFPAQREADRAVVLIVAQAHLKLVRRDAHVGDRRRLAWKYHAS